MRLNSIASVISLNKLFLFFCTHACVLSTPVLNIIATILVGAGFYRILEIRRNLMQVVIPAVLYYFHKSSILGST